MGDLLSFAFGIFVALTQYFFNPERKKDIVGLFIISSTPLLISKLSLFLVSVNFYYILGVCFVVFLVFYKNKPKTPTKKSWSVRIWSLFIPSRRSLKVWLSFIIIYRGTHNKKIENKINFMFVLCLLLPIIFCTLLFGIIPILPVSIIAVSINSGSGLFAAQILFFFSCFDLGCPKPMDAIFL